MKWHQILLTSAVTVLKKNSNFVCNLWFNVVIVNLQLSITMDVYPETMHKREDPLLSTGR